MKILIIGHDPALQTNLKPVLEANGYQAELVTGESAARDRAVLGCWDLLILDGETAGLDAVRTLREQGSSYPVLLLTNHAAVEDRIAYLNAGVDYFLVKPFDPRELLASVNALLLRRSRPDSRLAFGDTHLELSTATLVCGEQSIRLSARETEVMGLLLQSKDRNLAKGLILARVWGHDSHAAENHVEVYVGFLRKKLKAIGSNVRIASVRRLGYHLEMDHAL